MKTITNRISFDIQPNLFPVPLEEILFFDIETTGLSPRASSLYLIGTVSYDADGRSFHMTQWFADSADSEREILAAFLAQLENYRCLYHFNGRTFDIPYIMQKCHKYGLSLTKHSNGLLSDTDSVMSVDMMKLLRPLKKLFSLSHATQKDWERWLGIMREDKYSGGELIQVYSQYRQDLVLHPEQAQEKESLLLLHNHDDLLGMLSVADLLSYRYIFTRRGEPAAKLTDVKIQNPDTIQDHLVLSFRLPLSVPRKITLTKNYPLAESDSARRADKSLILPNCSLTLADDSGTFCLPVRQGEYKYFIPDYKNYYYLPQEDTAVHRSIAEFVDKEYRKKATAATCFIRQNGLFIPTLTARSKSDPIQSFRLEHKDRQCYYALPEEVCDETTEWLADYISAQLACFI